MKKSGLLIIIALFGIIFLGCNPNISSPVSTKKPIKLETDKPDIRGNVNDIFVINGEITGIFVKGNIKSDTVYDSADVGITTETRIYYKNGNNFVETDTSHLQVGQTVEAIFIGPILTSHPVQASALEIAILK